MPWRPKRPCTYPGGCSALVQSGRCPAHAVQLEHQRENFAVRRWYRTARWRALRDQVRREQPFCPDCEREGVLTPWTDLDHRRKHGGDVVAFFNRDNVAGLCTAHHSAKTARGE